MSAFSSESPVVSGPAAGAPVVRPPSSDLRPPVSSAFWRLGIPLAIFAILWVDLVRQLSYLWATNEQYAYGWFVPIFALGLFLKKWPTRPPATAQRPPSTVHLIVLLALALLPLRLIHEINQDWSFCSYALTAVVVALSLYAVYLVGGRPWVKYFAFPVCFILVAVNWPYRIENSLKHRLMNAVAASTVEILGWLDVPAMRHGNVIELSTTSVGVEDACSGIRSLQSTVMSALLLGELYLLSVPRRFLLLALGLPLAFCLNIVRVLFLTWQASSSGAAVIAKWHDSAGMTMFMICFACLWILAVVLKRSQRSETTGLRDYGTTGRQTDDGGQRPEVGGQRSEDRGQRTEDGSRQSGTTRRRDERLWTTDLRPPNSDLRSPISDLRSPPLLRRYLIAVGLWALFCAVATEGWYRAHDVDPARTVRWGVQYPTNALSAHKTWMDPEVLQVLKCDQGDGYSWEEPDGGHWSSFFFRWRAGAATSRMAARDHRPEYCLPSRGYRIKTDLGIQLLPAHGLELPFRAYVFEEEAQVLYVFFCLWEDGAETQSGLGNSKYLDRLTSVLTGRRRLGQQTFEIVLSGYADMAQAEQALRERLSGLVQLGAAPRVLSSLDQQSER